MLKLRRIKWTNGYRKPAQAIYSDYDNSPFIAFGEICYREFAQMYDAKVDIERWQKAGIIVDRREKSFPTYLAAVRWANKIMRQWVSPQ